VAAKDTVVVVGVVGRDVDGLHSLDSQVMFRETFLKGEGKGQRIVEGELVEYPNSWDILKP
jgi:hypothetical protein